MSTIENAAAPPATDTEPAVAEIAPVRSMTFVWICDHADQLQRAFDTYWKVLRDLPQQLELIVINNGLGLDAGQQLNSLLKSTDIRAAVLTFHAPTSESDAISSAFQHAQGEVIVLLPSYAQGDPQDIPAMLHAVERGLDYCASWRKPRIDSPSEQRKSKLFNTAVHWFAGIRLHDINSGLRMMRREVIQEIPLYGDLHIYLPVLAAQQGFRVGEIAVRHLEERPSRGGHGMSVYPRRAMDLLTLFFLTRFTKKPFRFFGGIGAGLLIVGALINIFLAFQKVVWSEDLADRPALVLGTLLMVLGLQSFSLGLIGELIIFVSAGGFAEYRVAAVFENSQATTKQPEDATTG